VIGLMLINIGVILAVSADWISNVTKTGMLMEL
jgi:hypothetical protein